MATDEILYERREGYALATFNRPDDLNAFSEPMFHRWKAIVEEFTADAELRALVFTGAGRAFTAGVDLKMLAGLARPADEVPLKFTREFLALQQDLTRVMLRCPKVTIAALNGITVGMGAELAIAADIRIAAPEAYFMFAEVRRGLFETNGVMWFLPRIVGAGRAAEMLLTGDRYSAEQCLAAGLVTKVVPQTELLPTATNMAQRIAANAPLSVRLVKENLGRTFDVDLEAMLQFEVEGNYEVIASEDLREGVQAFVERRPPVFRGR